MRKLSNLLILTLILGLTACGKSDTKTNVTNENAEAFSEDMENAEEEAVDENIVKISLSNGEILVNDEKISEDPEADVYQANDIIFYQADQGIEYGEGKKKDEHSQIEADAHTVVHITKPGTYELSGTMEAGQIFVDLGKDAKEDPEAVVTLILNGVDITCTVAPAIFFYNVYECSVLSEEEEPSMNIDLTGAGANLKIADETENKIYGSYVAKIYKSCELNEEGTEVIESKKLHKYDGAVYSKMSMNVYGDTGILDIAAENEGLCSEQHLTIHGGNLTIQSGNDGINTSNEETSIFTMNGGSLDITVTGKSGEGDGIDSNGWIVINGGTVNAWASPISMDSGLDSNNGIYLNGGTVAAAGHMLDEIADGKQNYQIFPCQEEQNGQELYEIQDSEENVILELVPENAFTMLVVSTEVMTEEKTYTLWWDDTQIAEGTTEMVEAMGPAGKPDGEKPPKDFEKSENNKKE